MGGMLRMIVRSGPDLFGPDGNCHQGSWAWDCFAADEFMALGPGLFPQLLSYFFPVATYTGLR